MTREEQIESMADNYYEDCIIKFYDDFIAGAQWADKTMLQEVLKWLEENFFTGEIEGYYSDVPEHIVQGKFDCKEDMLQSFKDRFNVE